MGGYNTPDTMGVYYPRIYLHSLLMILLMNLSNRKSAVVGLQSLYQYLYMQMILFW